MMDKTGALALGSDHAGFELKGALVEYLRKKGYDVRDVGPTDDKSVDYPDFAAKVADEVAMGRSDRGILVCGSGLGVAIAANKVPGIRAVTANDVNSARMSRAHNNANVLAIGARLIEPELARKVVDVWLGTEFEGGLSCLLGKMKGNE